MEVWFWAVLFTIAIAFQLHSVWYNNKWGMLTSSVRWLRARTVGRILLFPAWFWLSWHWFLEPMALRGRLYDDVLAIFAGVGIALLVDYDDSLRTMQDLFDSDPPE